jgi:hypothetical protein
MNFSVFSQKLFNIPRGTKMADCLGKRIKNQINYYYCDIFWLLNAKVEKFQLCLETVASFFRSAA